MITETADLLRLTNAGLGLLLSVTCTACIVFSPTWDQRRRFAVVLGYGLVTVFGQLLAMGRPLTGVTVLLTVVTAAAVLETSLFGWRTARRILNESRQPRAE